MVVYLIIEGEEGGRVERRGPWLGKKRRKSWRESESENGRGGEVNL